MKRMKRNFVFFTGLLILVFFQCQETAANDQTLKDDDTTLVYRFDITQKIDPSAWRITNNALKEAEDINADLILIRMNTYGGMVLSADSIRTKILNTTIPVYMFIDNNAASAGALISIACDRIYMATGANIGAATVVNQEGKAMPDKYQSYMRSTMRSTAQAHGKDTLISNGDTTYQWFRDPLIAEAMVDPRVSIEGIIDTGKVLTFTTQEAIRNGYCEGEANRVEEVLKQANIKNYRIESFKLTGLEKIIGFLVSPALQSILIMLIIGGIYFEMQSPGIGFALGVAILAALLYFAPLYLEGLAANWEILLFIGGLLLVALEVFVIPGFGVAGVSGIVLIIGGLAFSMVDKVVWDLEVGNVDKLFQALFIVSVSLFASLALSIYLGGKLFTSNRFAQLALGDVQDKMKGIWE